MRWFVIFFFNIWLRFELVIRCIYWLILISEVVDDLIFVNGVGFVKNKDVKSICFLGLSIFVIWCSIFFLFLIKVSVLRLMIVLNELFV